MKTINTKMHFLVPRGMNKRISAVLYRPVDTNRLVGRLFKVSTSRAADPGFNFHLRGGDFCGSSHASHLKIDTPVATLPGAWHEKVSAGTGWPGVSIL